MTKQYTPEELDNTSRDQLKTFSREELIEFNKQLLQLIATRQNENMDLKNQIQNNAKKIENLKAEHDQLLAEHKDLQQNIADKNIPSLSIFRNM